MTSERLHDILINRDDCWNYIQKDSLDEVDGIMSRISFEGMVTSNQSLQAFVEAGRVTQTGRIE